VHGYAQQISKHGGENIPNAGIAPKPRSFPADGSLGQQIDWFRHQFLKLADKASSTKERGEFLKLAFMATLKGENAFASDGAMALYMHAAQNFSRHATEVKERALVAADQGLQPLIGGELDIGGSAPTSVSINTASRSRPRRIVAKSACTRRPRISLESKSAVPAPPPRCQGGWA
jgi:hypothetical protein